MVNTPTPKYQDPKLCIKIVWDKTPWGAGPVSYQCRRKRGHGPDGEYCVQHGKQAQERLDRIAAEETATRLRS